jgi:3-oxoacyl-[acyl-carrier-protein] synthase-1/3-oxoacyl-[acyl-carrier-protein] synthase II
MAEALRDAGLSPGDIDYINLHGTGTPDNDRAEARAVLSLFGEDLPPVSSTKGSIGHTLAAAGAIEAVIAAAGIREGFIPPNVGFEAFDPDIGIPPIASPTPMPIRTAMSNAFGFGGNNAALIVGTPRQPGSDRPSLPSPPPLTVSGYACVSGAGRTGETMDAFFGGRSCSGRLPEDAISAALPPRTIRRLKRLSKLVLSLAAEACGSLSPSSISIGTGWGAMSETYDFLMRLFETGMQFPSPTDFIGSVHNAPGGQAAMHLNVKGANVTTTGGDYSFEQALLAADLLTRRTQEPVLLIGADEAHAALSPLFDASVRLGSELSDGGGGFLIARNPEGGGIGIELIYYRSGQTENVIGGLIEALGGPEEVLRRYAAVPAGIPAARRNEAEAQLAAFLSLTGFTGPVIDYRRHTGDFATAAAIAAAAAVRIVEIGAVPGPLASGNRTPLEGKGILLLGLGDFVTAVRIYRR